MQVTVARTAELPFLPSACRLADGRILLAFREARAHTHSRGRVLGTTSSDDGLTWSPPTVLVNTDHDDRDPMLTVLRNGDVMLSYFRIDWSTAPWTVLGVDVMRSTDSGYTWSEPVSVGSTMRQETDKTWHGYRSGHIASHGRIVELANGDLLAPIYGVFPGDPHHTASVVRSIDGGRTWPASQEVVLGRRHVEPVLTLLHDGSLVALLRTDEASPGTGASADATRDLRADLTRSNDNGHTWTPPERIDLHASSADTVALTDGRVLLAFGDASRGYPARRPTVATVIHDPHGPWDIYPRHVVLDAGETYDQANPTAVELPGNRILIASYDIFRREITATIRPLATLT